MEIAVTCFWNIGESSSLTKAEAIVDGVVLRCSCVCVYVSCAWVAGSSSVRSHHNHVTRKSTVCPPSYHHDSHHMALNSSDDFVPAVIVLWIYYMEYRYRINTVILMCILIWMSKTYFLLIKVNFECKILPSLRDSGYTQGSSSIHKNIYRLFINKKIIN